MAVSQLAARGVSGLPLLVVDHPLGGEHPEGIARRAHQAAEQLRSLLAPGARAGDSAVRAGTSPGGSGRDEAAAARAERDGAREEAEGPALVEVPAEADRLLEAFVAREWCDGLPVVPPTPERVRAMLGGRDPDRSLGPMPPLWREATLEALAVNAVMAGCRPEDFPVIVAAVEAMLDPAFNLYGVQATTHPVAPLVIVHGPYGRRIGVHAGSGCFGPGFRANATIGRAVRLILMNVGGGWPGRHDMATQGSPAKFSYCIAEHDAASPWGPLREGDAVTVFGGEAPHNVNDHVSTTAAGVLTTIADTAVSLGSNVGWYLAQSQLLVVLGPEHARTIADDGFTRADVQRFLYERARLPLGLLKRGGMWGIHDWPAWMRAVTDDQAWLPQVPSPDDVLVVVAGGPGKHSAVVPNCCFSRAVSRPIVV